MGNLKKRKVIPLSLFFLKYFIYLCIEILVIVICAFIIFNILAANNMVYRADYAQTLANNAIDKITEAKEVNENIVPKLCEYAVFSMNGKLKSGNIKKNDIKRAWEAVNGATADTKGYFYKVIPRNGEYCVLKYQILPQYKSASLRKYLPSPQNLIISIVIVLCLLCIIFTAISFGHGLRKKLTPLLQVTEKIQNQELNFSIASSSIKEINNILEAMEQMRFELKDSLQKQWQLEQIKKEQMAALAHDLKTPLTIIRGNADLLNETILTDEQRESTKYIQSSVLQMQEYVQALIEILKTEASLTIEMGKVDTNSFIENLKLIIDGLIIKKKIQFSWKIGELPEYININKTLFTRALVNVISNAIDFTSDNGTIAVSIRQINKLIEFKISDTGKGFTQEALVNAANQFYMEDESRSSGLHYGMGLYITNTIIKKHNGFLALANSDDYKGAEVKIMIPC